MKILKIVLLNFLVLALIIMLIDFCVYQKHVIAYKKNYSAEFLKVFPVIKYFENYRAGYEGQTIQEIDNLSFRNDLTPFNINKKEGGIIFIGCSYTFGTGIEDNEILSYLIYKNTNRNVLNLGIQAGGLQHFYYLINKNNFFKDNFPESFNPEYVFYTYIPNHIERLNSKIYPQPLMVNGYYVRYKLEDNKLELQKPLLPSFLYKSFIVKSFLYNCQIARDNEAKEIQDDNFALFNKLLIETRKIMEQKYPNIKFVILRYRTVNDGETAELPDMWDVLKEEGFIILDSEELIGRKFEYNSSDCTADNHHPSVKAWKMLVPKIIEKLNL